MRLFVSGSAPLLAETHARFATRTGHAILERYGMTETDMLTSNPYDGERRPAPSAFPCPGVEVRIVDRDRRARAAGEIGMIEVAGPNVFPGYWRDAGEDGGGVPPPTASSSPATSGPGRRATAIWRSSAAART